ncbi:MAG: hypothetical protein O7C75_13295 [Verrucomicrobia bacterium]|nr:hypothetical protein [Verrucomicrobiota bacterium]
MTFSNEELEKELASLKPQAPSEILEAKIDTALRGPEENYQNFPNRFWPNIVWAAAASLALVAAIFFFGPGTEDESLSINLTQYNSTETISTEFNGYEPIEAEQHLIEALDEGIIFNSDNEPMRRLRYQFVDTVTLVHKTDGSVFRMEVPREEVLYVPLTLL